MESASGCQKIIKTIDESQERLFKKEKWLSKLDELSNLVNKELDLIDTAETNSGTYSRLQSSKDSYNRETCAYLCQFLELDYGETDPRDYLKNEEEQLTAQVESDKEKVSELKQLSKDLEKQINDQKCAYRQLREELSALERHEVLQLAKHFGKWTPIANATYKTNDDGRATAVYLQHKDVIRRIWIEDPHNKTPEERIKEFWKIIKYLALKV